MEGRKGKRGDTPKIGSLLGGQISGNPTTFVDGGPPFFFFLFFPFIIIINFSLLLLFFIYSITHIITIMLLSKLVLCHP